MYRMKKMILLTALAGAVLGAGAQEGKKMLSFDDALVRTMTNNPEISALQYEEKAAEQERKAAFGLRLPQIGVTGTYAHLGKDIGVDLNGLKEPVKGLMEGMGGTGILPPEILQQAGALLGQNWGMTIQDRNTAFVGGSVTMPLYTGGKINAANNAAKINERTTREKGAQSRNALVSQLAEYYYGLALANQVVAVRQQVVDGVRVHLNDAIALEKNGIISQGDRLYAEVKMAEAERELLQSRLQARTVTTALSSTLNEEQEFVPVSPMFILEEIEDVAYFKDLAAKNNPLLNQVALKRDLAKENVRLQRSEFLPQIALGGGTFFYNYQFSKYLPTWAVGAGIQLKIFDGLNREYKFSAAKNTVRQVEALQTKAGNEISVLIEKLYNEMRTYHDQMPSIEASLKFAQEYLRIQNAAFKEGMASSADVIDAQLNLAKIKTERIQAAYYYDLMLARLLEAAGASEQFADYGKRPTAVQIRFEE